MEIKITYDPDGGYGYGQGLVIDAEQVVSDYISTLNEVEDSETIYFLQNTPIEFAVDFVAEMWDLQYQII